MRGVLSFMLVAHVLAHILAGADVAAQETLQQSVLVVLVLVPLLTIGKVVMLSYKSTSTIGGRGRQLAVVQPPSQLTT